MREELDFSTMGITDDFMFGTVFQDLGLCRGLEFICAHDPFGRGWKRYDYLRLCEQDGEPLGDGTSIVFVNAEGTRGDFGDGFDAFMSYLRDDNVIGSDFVRSVDDAVCGFRDDPGWRRFRMLWSEKYRNEFADAFDEGKAKGKAEGKAEGIAEGRAEGFSRAATLMSRLMADGRERELEEATRDPGRMERLLEEYGLS
ncbi:hypothetical protein [Parafannyhessea umbonata]|uniref:Rpn family recombination-promoting nuclease/putative transposase n=1 Tax=Parafannyhessea umbonata TaxID=604330 RepID=A0A1G6KRH7_9ACTN|nr:hypothetical protein [Parafannyhessea umbonata]SDC32936.1 hypothetical protein SAMN04487824_10941 [Parafannyhessea umbonata]